LFFLRFARFALHPENLADQTNEKEPSMKTTTIHATRVSPVSPSSICATSSDDDLLAATAAGDRRAVDLLYRRHAAALRAAARSVIGKHDASIADDAVADVFVVLLEGRATVFHPEKGRALSWLKGIAVTAAQEHLRGRTSARLPRGKPEPMKLSKGGQS
jgi:hypothetical protein